MKGDDEGDNDLLDVCLAHEKMINIWLNIFPKVITIKMHQPKGWMHGEKGGALVDLVNKN